MIYYVIPRELADKYYEEFKKRFEGVEGVEVIIDRRESERRASDRGGRQAGAARPPAPPASAARSRTCDACRRLRPVRLDLHNHTSFSSDGVMSPAELLRAARASGLGCIAVTDHNTVEGALEAAGPGRRRPHPAPGHPRDRAVHGRRGGHRALRAGGRSRAGCPLDESIALIRQQGGLVYLPHPFDVIRRGTIASERARAGGRAGRHRRGAQRPLAEPAGRCRNAARLARRPRQAAGGGQRRPRAAGGGPGLRRRRSASHPGDSGRRWWPPGVVRDGLHWHEYAAELGIAASVGR